MASSSLEQNLPRQELVYGLKLQGFIQDSRVLRFRAGAFGFRALGSSGLKHLQQSQTPGSYLRIARASRSALRAKAKLEVVVAVAVAAAVIAEAKAQRQWQSFRPPRSRRRSSSPTTPVACVAFVGGGAGGGGGLTTYRQPRTVASECP